MSADNRLEVKQPVTVTVRIPDAHSFNPANPLTPTLTFTDRIAGGSKMSRRIVAEASWRVPTLRARAFRGRLPRGG